MKKILSIVALGALMAGCGGSNLISAVTGGHYDGSYNGQFTDPNGVQPTWSTSFRVVAGVLTGNVTAGTTSLSISGNIDNNGNFNASVATTPTATVLSGAVNLNGTQLTGSLAESGGATGTLNISATLQ